MSSYRQMVNQRYYATLHCPDVNFKAFEVFDGPGRKLRVLKFLPNRIILCHF